MPREDEKWMGLALRLARRGLGNVYPNPSVRCILVKENRVVGRGWTQKGGRPHAEVMALRQAGEASQGATAYCTLEPCAHFGKSAPCCDALINAGVSSVVVAMRDPDPRVDGRGLEKLKRSGIKVKEGICSEQALKIMEGFLSVVRTGSPVITLKIAMSIDSRISTKNGESKWITGEASRKYGHLLRANHDAILTGIGTIITDNPRLDCRLKGLEERSPVRVLLDTNLRVSMNSNFVGMARDKDTFLFTSVKTDEAKREKLVALGLKVVTLCVDEDGQLPVRKCLKVLAKNGITTILIEAGGQVASSLVRHDLVDKLIVYRAPIVIGGDGIAACHPIGVEGLDDAKKFNLQKLQEIDGDIMEFYNRHAKV